MTRERIATLTASIGAGLLLGTAGFHLSAYGSITAQTAPTQQPLVAALWIAGGASLIIAGLLTIAVTPVFIVRRRALLAIGALTPLSIAVLQVAFLGFLPATALLLLDAVVLLGAGELGRALQPLPVVRPKEAV